MVCTFYEAICFKSCLVLFCSNLCFSVLLALRLPRLGKRILVLFERLFDLPLFGFVCFLFLLMSGKGCGYDCDTPWTFLLPFFWYDTVNKLFRTGLRWFDVFQQTNLFLRKHLRTMCVIGLNNSLLNIMSTTQTYKNDIEDQITS